jgi:hypothetical protein
MDIDKRLERLAWAAKDLAAMQGASERRFMALGREFRIVRDSLRRLEDRARS